MQQLDPRVIEMTGTKWGRWEVLGKAPTRPGGASWNCRCECGEAGIVRGVDLRKGLSKSCGCFSSDFTTAANLTHGYSRTSIYSAWLSMIRRCAATKGQSYRNYGARGITVCERWHSSFENFLADMGQKPSPRHSLDRIDNDKGYSPDNCRWATRREQNNNRRGSCWIEFRGKRVSLGEALTVTGDIISQPAAKARLELGWDVEAALTTPVQSRRFKGARHVA